MADLISRDVAIAKIKEWCAMEEAKSILTILPVVDAAPVIHGRWIKTQIPANTTGHSGVGQDKKKAWLCSNCRCAFDAELLWRDHYCPNCGAKMNKAEV